MPRKAPSLPKNLAGILLCLLGGLAAVNAFAHAEFHQEGVSYSAQITLGTRGETVLSIPPVGVATARTHKIPVRIRFELRSINPSLLRNQGRMRAPAHEQEIMVRSIKRAALYTAFLAAALAGLGSLMTGCALRFVRPRVVFTVCFLSAALCSGLLFFAYKEYKTEALKQPSYDGILYSAPWVMSVLSDSLSSPIRWGQGFRVMAKNMPRLAQAGEPNAPLSNLGEDLRVLHVSDIHSNLAAYDLVESLVAGFKVDLILDTGDLTDFGAPLEGELAGRIGRLGVPYLFSPGNHDSPEIIARLTRIHNVIVLKNRVITVKGLRILGLPDPSSFDERTAVAEPGVLASAAAALSGKWQQLKVKPEIVMAHNRAIVAPLIGLAPVILHGHDHRVSLAKVEGSWIEDAGTTGAIGLQKLMDEGKIPYSVDLQYWRKNGADHLEMIAVDTIEVYDLHSDLHIRRQIISQPQALPAGPGSPAVGH